VTSSGNIMNRIMHNFNPVPNNFFRSEEYLPPAFLDPFAKAQLFDKVLAENRRLKRMLSILMKQKPDSMEVLANFSNEAMYPPLTYDNLASGSKEREGNLLALPESTLPICKEEAPSPHTSPVRVKEEDSASSSSHDLYIKEEDDEDEFNDKKPQIMRRNGFKALKSSEKRISTKKIAKLNHIGKDQKLNTYGLVMEGKL